MVRHSHRQPRSRHYWSGNQGRDFRQAETKEQRITNQRYWRKMGAPGRSALRHLPLSMAFVGLGLLTAGLPLLGQARPLSPAHSQKLEKNVSGNGRLIFDANCAGCHGLDGRGGERAPDLTARNVQQLSDQEISRIVVNGVAGTAMPAFHLLRQSEMTTLLGYIRSLQGKDYGKAALPGDPAQGKLLFFGKAKCSACHLVGGHGGFIASDLSTYAAGRSAQEILRAIESPAATPAARHRLASVTTREGRTYRGLVRNEDNFSLQLQAPDGTFHLFLKSDLRNVEYASEPLMPANYGSTLSRRELDDIVRYLVSTATMRQPQPGISEPDHH